MSYLLDYIIATRMRMQRMSACVSVYLLDDVVAYADFLAQQLRPQPVVLQMYAAHA